MNAGHRRSSGSAGAGTPHTARLRLLGGVVLALGLAALIGCRGSTVFEGVEMQASTGSVKIAAPAPLCGCATFLNTTPQAFVLHAAFNGRATGSAVLAANQSLQVRFDWAGPATDDFYLLEGTTEAGQHVNLSKALRVQVSNWQDCNTASCSYGTLGMNVGTNAH